MQTSRDVESVRTTHSDPEPTRPASRCRDVAKVEPARHEPQFFSEIRGNLLGRRVVFGMNRVHDEAARGPIGLEIHSRHESVAEEERKAVIAELALLGRRVDLDAVTEAEQPFRAGPFPDEGVEGRDQRAGLDTAGQPVARVEINGSLPTLDADGKEVAGLDELGNAGLGVDGLETKIVPEAALARNPESADRMLQQCALRLLRRWRRRFQDLGREHPFGEVVDAFEAAPTGRRDLPRPEQPFERPLSVAPAPPRAPALGAALELAGAQRTAGFDLAPHRGDEIALLPFEPGKSPVDAFPPGRSLHPPAEQGMQVDPDERGLVTPVLKEPPAFPTVRGVIDERALVGPEPRE